MKLSEKTKRKLGNRIRKQWYLLQAINSNLRKYRLVCSLLVYDELFINTGSTFLGNYIESNKLTSSWFHRKHNKTIMRTLVSLLNEVREKEHDK